MAPPLPGVPVEVMVTQPLPGVPVVVMVTQPLPVVPVVVMVTQPLPGVPVVRRHHRRRHPVRLLFPDHRDPGVATVRLVVEARGGRPLRLRPGLPVRTAPCGVGGCTG